MKFALICATLLLTTSTALLGGLANAVPLQPLAPTKVHVTGNLVGEATEYVVEIFAPKAPDVRPPYQYGPDGFGNYQRDGTVASLGQLTLVAGPSPERLHLVEKTTAFPQPGAPDLIGSFIVRAEEPGLAHGTLRFAIERNDGTSEAVLVVLDALEFRGMVSEAAPPTLLDGTGGAGDSWIGPNPSYTNYIAGAPVSEAYWTEYCWFSSGPYPCGTGFNFALACSNSASYASTSDSASCGKLAYVDAYGFKKINYVEGSATASLRTACYNPKNTLDWFQTEAINTEYLEEAHASFPAKWDLSYGMLYFDARNCLGAGGVWFESTYRWCDSGDWFSNDNTCGVYGEALEARQTTTITGSKSYRLWSSAHGAAGGSAAWGTIAPCGACSDDPDSTSRTNGVFVRSLTDRLGFKTVWAPLLPDVEG